MEQTVQENAGENEGNNANANNDERGSRDAKWWCSTFHNVTAMSLACHLLYPSLDGVTAIMLSWLVTFYTLWQLVEMHEMVAGRRFDRYYELGEHMLGPKLGFWLVMVQQLTVQIASTIVYCVTGGKSLKKFFDLLVPGWSGVRQTFYILFFILLQFLLSQTPNFNKLKLVSMLAALIYSTVAVVTSIIIGVRHHPSHYGVRSDTVAGMTFDVFTALGTIAFAFAGHSVVLEIQATLPSTEEVPSKKPMWRGVVSAYLIVILCYMAVAVSGYWAFGSAVEDDVLISLEHPAWVIAVANLMVFVHVIGSFQVHTPSTSFLPSISIYITPLPTYLAAYSLSRFLLCPFLIPLSRSSYESTTSLPPGLFASFLEAFSSVTTHYFHQLFLLHYI
ncbi:hypothetical protein Ahy_A05g021687 [Arachis hypogaea]|uniref:Amino acid transporter transmembrane domain-containing protein n=1 Tax=Arachis hypogaea TaxID=3818 RepID=A0A445CXV9_ARAHY|nr:hypothetical protein Ahy_A05g021687 [Arachis hypogaea]